METGSIGTWIFVFHGPEERRDWLSAELGELGFGAFDSSTPNALKAYLAEDMATLETLERVERCVAEVGFQEESRHLEPAQNWNLAWESSIEPVEAGRFWIHPPWHPERSDHISICIEPKMSFGTAHHETTRLVLTLLSESITGGERVLDAGSGTGILAIASRRLGASSAVAFDIDPWSAENTDENLQRNGIDAVEARVGGIEVAGKGPFDLILANINRNILLEMIPAFSERLAPQGRVILSGVLVADDMVMRQAIERAGWRVERVLTEGDWLAISAKA